MSRALIVVGAIVGVYAVAVYLTHLLMTFQDNTLPGVRPKPISFGKALKKLKEYFPNLCRLQMYSHSVQWNPQHDVLVEELFESFKKHAGESNAAFSVMDDFYDNYKYEWHASLLYIDNQIYYMGPISYFLFFLHNTFFIYPNVRAPEDIFLACLNEAENRYKNS